MSHNAPITFSHCLIVLTVGVIPSSVELWFFFSVSPSQYAANVRSRRGKWLLLLRSIWESRFFLPRWQASRSLPSTAEVPCGPPCLSSCGNTSTAECVGFYSVVPLVCLPFLLANAFQCENVWWRTIARLHSCSSVGHLTRRQENGKRGRGGVHVQVVDYRYSSKLNTAHAHTQTLIWPTTQLGFEFWTFLTCRLQTSGPSHHLGPKCSGLSVRELDKAPTSH